MSLNMYTRKVLEQSNSFWQDRLTVTVTATAEAPAPNSTQENVNLDKNLLFILSIITCGVILSFIMHFVIEYALKRLSSASSDPAASSSSSSASRGIKQEALEAFPVVSYSAEVKLPGQDTECVICLLDFVSGDQLRILPKCNHGFHVACIDQWLGSHSTCPKCRHCLIKICEKIGEHSGQATGSHEPFLPAEGSTPCSLPPERETVIQIYRSSS